MLTRKLGHIEFGISFSVLWVEEPLFFLIVLTMLFGRFDFPSVRVGHSRPHADVEPRDL